MQWRQSSVALNEKQNPQQPFLLHRFKLWDNFPQWDVGPFVSSASLVGLTRRCDEAYVRDASIRHVRHCSWLIWIWKCHGRGWSEKETKEGVQERKMSERFHLRLKYFPWDTNFHVLTSGTAVAAWRPQTGGHTQTVSLSNGASVSSDHYLYLASSYIPPFFPSCCLVRPLGWKLLKPLSFDLSFLFSNSLYTGGEGWFCFCWSLCSLSLHLILCFLKSYWICSAKALTRECRRVVMRFPWRCTTLAR